MVYLVTFMGGTCEGVRDDRDALSSLAGGEGGGVEERGERGGRCFEPRGEASEGVEEPVRRCVLECRLEGLVLSRFCEELDLRFEEDLEARLLEDGGAAVVVAMGLGLLGEEEDAVGSRSTTCTSSSLTPISFSRSTSASCPGSFDLSR